LYLLFETLTLPNGVSRDFRARPASLDADTAGKLDREEGRIEGRSGKGKDASTIAEAAAAGASVGGIAGSVSGRSGMGVGLGAAAGLAGVVLSRGPDTVLDAGAVLEMVLDRDLRFEAADLNFSSAGPP
jgi:type IV secretion system protein VirB10